MAAQLANVSLPPEELYAVPLAMDHLLPTSQRTARLLLFGLIAGFGVLSNLTSMVVLVRSKLVKQWTYAMLLNVTVADLIFCFMCVVTYLPCVIMDRFIFPDVMCYIRLALMFTCAGGSIFSYLCMAIQRFVVIVLNRPHMSMFQVRWLPVLLPILWVCAVVIISPYYFLGEVFVVHWRDNCFPYSTYANKVMEPVTLTYIYLPSAISLSLYVAIYVVVRRSSARMQVNGKRERKDAKMALVLFSLLALFIVAYAPYFTFASLRKYMSIQVQKICLLTGWFTAITISACNPIIYAIIFKPIQKQYFAILWCPKFNKRKVSPLAPSDLTATAAN